MVRPHHRFFVVLSLVAMGARANSAIVGGETGHDALQTMSDTLAYAVLTRDVGRIMSMVALLAGPLVLLLGVMLAFRSKQKPWRAPLLGALGMVFACVAIVVALAARTASAPIAAAPASTSTSTVAVAPPSATNEIPWVHITDTADALSAFDAALAKAKAAHQPVFIDFGAEWCTACKELDKTTFVDAAVRAEAARFVGIKVDATTETPALNAIQERFGVVGLPTIAFIGSDGVYLDTATQAPRYEAVTGYTKALEFLPQLQRVH